MTTPSSPVLTWRPVQEDSAWGCQPHPLKGIAVAQRPLNSLLQPQLHRLQAANVLPPEGEALSHLAEIP